MDAFMCDRELGVLYTYPVHTNAGCMAWTRSSGHGRPGLGMPVPSMNLAK